MKSNSSSVAATIDVATAAAADGAMAPAAHGRRWSGRRAPKRSRRDAILQSVGNVLRDTRLSSLTMQDIAVELGITKGNLYYYFRDKQDILYQCHMRCMDLSLEALNDARAALATEVPGDSVHICLRTLLIRHMLGILDHGFGNVLLTDLDNLSPQQRRRYVAKRDDFESGVRAIIEAGVANGEFACSDVKLAGLSMLGAINWIPKWYDAGGALGSMEVAEGMADFLMRALEVRPLRAAEA
jgi:AcrR family transcriptional regulator